MLNESNAISLQAAVAQDALSFMGDRLINCLRNFHPVFAAAKSENGKTISTSEGSLIEVNFNGHLVRVMGMNQHLPDSLLEQCVASAPYDFSYKKQIAYHQAQLRLFYIGEHIPAWDQYVYLTGMLAALKDEGVLAALNEVARTSLPTAFLMSPEAEMDRLEYLRKLPLFLLYCGVSRIHPAGATNSWVRTYGAEKFGLANIAVEADPKASDIDLFGFLSNVLQYYIYSSRSIQLGDISEYSGQMLSVRSPNADEYFLFEGDSQTLVFEPMN
jgi:hypothetical protein